ncbi:unnamed protein product [Polarella glacialis]|uniref:Uncharacterized protein n=1 Tax=Polarella glacialis TaxID=89957 RepID=A0A813JP18_POLGL|nr:unnamed protein product [Polarella glacialis]CAE8680011.1 unnamed protein product [Polarella glacialis]
MLDDFARKFHAGVQTLGDAAERLSNESKVRKLPCGHTFNEISTQKIKMRGVSPHCPVCRSTIPKEFLMSAIEMADHAVQLQRRKVYDESRFWASTALELDPDCGLANFVMGVLHYEGWGGAKDMDRAAAHWEVAHQSENACATVNLAHLLRSRGNVARARLVLEEACAAQCLCEDQLKAMVSLGKLERDEGNVARARQLWELALSKGSADAADHLGLLFKKQGNYTRARELFEKARAMGHAGAAYQLLVIFLLK